MLMKEGLGFSAISRISAALAATMAEDFSPKAFEKRAITGLDELELKQRVSHLIVVLSNFLPRSFDDASVILMALPDVWDAGDPDDSLSGFAMWPLTDYVATYGMESPHTALQVLHRLTPLFTAEFAVRPFLVEHPDVTLAFLRQWVSDPNEHVRRLVSEGMRPRLPWGMQLKKYIADPEEILPFLTALRLDKSDYVRRSVANNLNDISKDHPEITLRVCEAWQASDRGKTDKLIRHATRTLVKQGNPRVFPLLDFTAKPAVAIKDFMLEKTRVAKGERLDFSFSIEGSGREVQRIVVDFCVYYMRSNGKRTRKVFKLKNVTLGKGMFEHFHKHISFKEITTRKYYAGQHELAIHVNGNELARKSFELLE